MFRDYVEVVFGACPKNRRIKHRAFLVIFFGGLNREQIVDFKD